MRNATTDNPNRERSYLNTIMTVIALLLAVIAFDLVVGTDPGVSKLNQADKLNTERLTEAAFFKKIGEG